MKFILEHPARAIPELEARAEANLAQILPRVGPVLAVLLVAYTVWDALLDPAHAARSGVIRAVFALLASLAFWRTIIPWSAHLRAAWVHWMLLGGAILASAQLDGGLVEGAGGVVIGIFLVPFIANGGANFALVVGPPALLFAVCSAVQCTRIEMVRGLMLYASAVAVAYLQMRIAVALRVCALAIESRLTWDATHDALTGSHNRAWLTQEAVRAFATARRHRTDLAFAMLDIDHFKHVNDTYGHQVGDEVLKAVARAAADALRETDMFGRLGGEEFFCILPHTPPAQAGLVAERIRAAVAAAAVPLDGANVQVTISIGVAGLEDAHASWEDLLKDADDALYAAKQSGRDCVRLAA